MSEKAARQAHEDGQDAQISQLGGRIQQLEDRVRGLTQSLSTATGNNEELAHQIQELRQKIDAQQKDFAYRLCMISAQQLGADASDQGLNCSATGSSPAPAANNGLPPNYAPGTPQSPIGSDNQSFNGPALTGMRRSNWAARPAPWAHFAQWLRKQCRHECHRRPARPRRSGRRAGARGTSTMWR